MQAIVNNTDQQRVYPRLMKSLKNDQIVLFSSSSTGTILFTKYPENMEHFSGLRNIDDYTDFNGTITLSN